jgi:hypothetical protein
MLVSGSGAEVAVLNQRGDADTQKMTVQRSDEDQNISRSVSAAAQRWVQRTAHDRSGNRILVGT